MLAQSRFRQQGWEGIKWWKLKELLSVLNTSKPMNLETPMDSVTSSMLRWMVTNCRDLRSVDLTLQSLAGENLLLLPRWPLWRCNTVHLVVQQLQSCLKIIKNPWANSLGLEQHTPLEACSLYSCLLKFLISSVHGEGLSWNFHSNGLNALCNGFQFILESCHYPPESLSNELKTSLIHVLRNSQWYVLGKVSTIRYN